MRLLVISFALVETLTFKQNGNTRLTMTKGYDHLNRLTNVVWKTNAVALLNYSYQYNNANQRTRVDISGTASAICYWLFQYDALGQVISGKKYWADGTPVAGQQSEYAFDDIGNRKYAAEGGDQWGRNLHYSFYTANLLNQYSQRTVPGKLDIVGTATNTAFVTVNDQSAYRRGEYFWKALATTNSGGAIWQAVTNLGVLNNGSNPDIVASNYGCLFIPQTPEQFQYDDDGNLTQDGRWNFTWDAENRLTEIISRDDTPAASKRKLEFAYDYQGRRIQKIVSTNCSWSCIGVYTNKFVWDGWNLIAVLSPESSPILSFTWGLDASGTMQGAGGVGGLISMTVHTGANTGTYFYCYDGNHNVVALVSAADGSAVAQYEYDAFGRLIRATGPLAFVNPFLFSTKYVDWETGFYYYGYRYYDPNTGRWLSRDPINEPGFQVMAKLRKVFVRSEEKNLYCFVNNDGANKIDKLGLEYWSLPACCTCGPDVTGLVNRILAKIDKDFQQQSTADQLGACLGLFVPPYAWNAWDMTTILQLGESYDSKRCQSCQGKLTYNGGCYAAEDINYIMFGHMFSLCNSEFPGLFPARDVGAIVAGGKWARFYSVGCAVAFATGKSCDGVKGCLPNPKSYDGPGEYRWDGINTRY